MEAMTQEFMLHRRPHAEIWSAREGSDDDTSKIHLRNTPLTDPKQCQQRTRDPPQKPKSDGSQQTMVHLRYHKTEINHNHKIWHTQPHHMSTWPTSETSDAASVTNSWQHPTTSEDQNKTWTKHRCSSLDPITHPIRNRRLRQILTARILRRRKSRRRNGKP